LGGNWDNLGRPPNPKSVYFLGRHRATTGYGHLIVTGSHLIAGAPEAPVRRELANCIAAALKPESGGYAPIRRNPCSRDHARAAMIAHE
jgi:hypothetical protein